MIDISTLSGAELRQLKREIAAIESKKTRRYEITFTVEFFAIQEESDLDDIDGFCSSFPDVFLDTYPIHEFKITSSKELPS
jgi:hypothetical protein